MKKAIISFLITFLIGGAALAGYWYYQGLERYTGVFLPGTTINGIAVDGMTPEAFEAQEKEKALYGEFTVHEMDGATETIALSDIISQVSFAQPTASFLSEDDVKKWPLTIRESRAFTDEISVTFDDDLLRNMVSTLHCISGNEIIAPSDAYFTQTEDGFAIVPEIDGNTLDEDKVFETIRSAIDAGVFEADLEEADCYIKAAVRSDDPSLTEKMAEAQKVMSVVLTMDMTNASETIDWSVYGSWITWDGVSFSLNEDMLREYVSGLDRKYRTYQTRRYFTTHAGTVIEVGGEARDTYGFWMDVDTTAERLKNALLSWQSQAVEVKWKTNALTRGQDNGDIGGTYIEISIADQHLWYCRGYQSVFETDVVTGKDSDESRRTPTGVFCVLSRLKDHTMSGSYGSQFCHYFMAFDWTGCAMHDAYWRDEFGGTVYLEDGSHGCVNIPPEAMEQLFGMVNTATPVIIY